MQAKQCINPNKSINIIPIQNSVSIATLNVCGLKTRSKYPDFIELVKQYDVFTVCETKIDKFDVIKVPGYTFINSPRKQKFIRKSGGLGVFINDSIIHCFQVIESSSEYILWLKFSNKSTPSFPIILGIVYIPPVQSTFF